MTCVRFSSVGWDANWNKKLTDDNLLRSVRLICLKKLCIYYKKCFTIFVISAVGLQLFAHTLVLHHLNMVLKIKWTLKAKRCINLEKCEEQKILNKQSYNFLKMFWIVIFLRLTTSQRVLTRAPLHGKTWWEKFQDLRKFRR